MRLEVAGFMLEKPSMLCKIVNMDIYHSHEQIHCHVML